MSTSADDNALDPSHPARAEAYASPEGRTALLKDQAAHDRRLRIAAGVTNVYLHCSNDTWYSIKAGAFGFFGLGAPRELAIGLSDGIAKVPLSGPQLIAVIDGMRRVALRATTWRSTLTDKLLAERVYAACAFVVDTVEAGNATGMPLSPIVIDDRVPGADQ